MADYDKNTENKVEEKIRMSAEKTEIPPGLLPEHLGHLLEDTKKKQTPKIPWMRFAVPTAGAVLAVFFVVLLWAGNGNIMKKEAPLSAAKQVAGEKEKQEETDIETLEYFVHPESYEKLYEILSAKQTQKEIQYGVYEEIAKEETSVDAGSATGTYSRTNLRTQEVEEGDLVKTDGTYIYRLSQSGKLHIVRADRGNMELVSTINLENSPDIPVEFFVQNDTLYVISESSIVIHEEVQDDMIMMRTEDKTTLSLYDIKDRNSPTLKKAVTQSGRYQTSRTAEGYLYLISRFSPCLSGQSSARQEDSFLPLNENGIFALNDIMMPKEDMGKNYIVLSAICLEDGKTMAQKSVLMEEGDCYVSENNLYFYTCSYGTDGFQTDILCMSYDKGKIAVKSSGSIPGTLKDTFCIDEYKDHIRLVCNRDGRNALYVLNRKLEKVGSISDIAPGEEIKSARFLGDTGYFVTYKNIDPLFSVDLKNPKEPKLTGELKVSGFSEYLHPFGEDQLLGAGWETDPISGERKGLKISMFRTTEGEMKELHKTVINNIEYCPGLSEYKAIFVDQDRGLLGIAMETYHQREQKVTSCYKVFYYEPEEGFQEILSVPMEDYLTGENFYMDVDTARGLYIGTVFYLSSDQGIQAYDMEKEYQNIGNLLY